MEVVIQKDKVSSEIEKEVGSLPVHYDTKSKKVYYRTSEDGVVVNITKENVLIEILDSESNKSTSFQLKSDDPSSSSMSSTYHYYLKEKSIEELRELYLEKLYKEKQGQHEFYCPNCKVCITKVFVKDLDHHQPKIPDHEDDQIRPICTSCFSFLIPLGWFFSKLQGPSVDPTNPGVVPEASREGGSEWEMMKSVVYGGLAESITSLGIITSAATADISTLNIVTLALANLVGGLFIIAHNLWDLKHDHSKVPASDDVTEEQVLLEVERYEEILGNRRHFVLHAFVSILSFLVFGLVPPVVYGFSFRDERNDNNKDLKLAAVAAASVVCIALLSFAKAYTQKRSKYIKTVSYYVVVGFGVSGASYLAGLFINKMMKKLGWFEPTTHAITMSLDEMSWNSWQ